MIKISRFYSRGYTDILMFFLVLAALATPFLISIPVGSADHVTFYSQLSPPCRSAVQFVGGSMRITDPSLPGCNEHDKAFINGPSAPSVLPPITTTQKEAYPGANSPADCTASITNWAPFFNPTCWLRMLGALFTSIFVWIGIKILVFAGFLFNYLLDYTVIKFGDMYALIKTGVETGWTAFRDIANILIIGIFTFIALSIILGLKEYGQKKMIANVLIIAVLINFSLLFTKMIIDASNFTALQFYDAALSQVAGGGSQSSTVNVAASGSSAAQQETVSTEGISGQFMKAIGITGFGDSYNQIRGIQEANKDGFIGIGFGILSLIYFLGAAIVLFYGCFLLASRAILIIFLMITSSLAFASYLVPAWETSSYGWKTWWDSLLRVAAFAPLLMLFLWITLLISQQLAVATGTKTIGGMATAPKENVAAVFGYIIILGLLYLSFKLSSVWASKISGFNFASMASALPLTLGSRFLLGAAGRATIGARAYFTGKGLTKEAEEARNAAAVAERGARRHERVGNFGLANQAWAEAERQKKIAASKLTSAGVAGSLADRKFNIMDTSLAKRVAKEVGVTGFAAGASSKDTKSFAGQVKERAEAAEKMAAKIAPSAEDNEKARVQREQVIREERRGRREQLEATRDAAKGNAEAVKGFEQLAQKLDAAQQDARTVEDTASRNKVIHDERLRSGTMTPAEHASEMRMENDRINKANKIVQTIQGRINTLEQPVKDAEKNVGDWETDTKEAVEQAQKEIVVTMADSAAGIAEKVGAQQGDVLTRALGAVTGANKAVADETKKVFKKKVSTAKLRDVFSSIQTEQGPAAPPPAAPPTTP